MSTPSLKKGPAQLSSILLLLGAIFIPLFFLPGVVDPGNWQKRILVGVLALVLTTLWVIQTLISRRAVVTLSKPTIFFGAFAGVSILSALFTHNALYHLTNFPVTWFFFALFLVFGSTLARSVRWQSVLQALLFPATIATLIALLQFTPMALSESLNRVFGTAYPSTLAFNPTDSFLALVAFVLPVGVAAVLSIRDAAPNAAREKQQQIVMIWGLVLTLIALVLAYIGFNNPAVRPFILPWSAGWNIAVESFKSVPTLLFGFGPSSFLNAFHQYRGIGFNAHEYWSVRFASSSNEFLFLLATHGVLGVGALLASFKTLLPILRTIRSRQLSLVVYLCMHLAAFFVIPFTPLLWFTFLLGIIVALSEASLLRSEEVWSAEVPENIRFPWASSLGTAGVVTAVVGVISVFMIAPLRSNFLLGWSLQQASTADAQTVYAAQAQAMTLTPFHPEYRRAFASTSFAIVQAMQQEAQTQGAELSEEQQKLALSLLQQAVNEGRNAVAADPSSTESWEVLASVYSNILSLEGAADWALAARIQAIQTDPFNPELRLALGQLYARLGEQENAFRLYEQAIQLNPRWVQSYYLLGESALSIENAVVAQAAFEKTLELLASDSPERPVVEDKLRVSRELLKNQQEAAALQAEQNATSSGQENTQNETGNAVFPETPTQPEDPTQENPPTGFSDLF